MTAGAGAARPAYRRIVLKLSGEALAGSQGYGIDPQVLARMAAEMRDVTTLGVQVAIVIGGGNILRGLAASRGGVGRATPAHAGSLPAGAHGPPPADPLDDARLRTPGTSPS